MGIDTIRKININLRRGTLVWHSARPHAAPEQDVLRMGKDVYHEIDGHNTQLTEVVGSAREVRAALARRAMMAQGNEYLAFHDVEAQECRADDWHVAMTDASLISLDSRLKPARIRHVRAEHFLARPDALIFGEVNGIGMEVMAMGGVVYTNRVTYEVAPSMVAHYVQAAAQEAEERVVRMMTKYLNFGSGHPAAQLTFLPPGFLAGAALLILNDLFPKELEHHMPVITDDDHLGAGVTFEVTLGEAVAIQVLRDRKIRLVMNRPASWGNAEYPMKGRILALGEQQLLSAA